MKGFCRTYLSPNMLAIMVLGLVSGLPLALSFSTLSVWLTEEGVSRTAIGLFALVGLPYTLKFLWAPLVDQLSLGWLTAKIGRRCAWLLVAQICLVGSMVGLGFSHPSDAPQWTAFWALMVAFFSATQDIIVDAYRVELLEDEEQAAGAAASVFGYRVGMLISSAGALVLASFVGWKLTYVAMAALVPLGLLVMAWRGEQTWQAPKAANMGQWLRHAVVDPFGEFASRSGWWQILLFILLYKLADAMAGVMTNPFLIELGFDKIDIATIVKTYGLVATFVGLFAGGWLMKKTGIWSALFVAAILQMVSNLMFVWQAQTGADASVLMMVISAENFSGGVGTAVFVGYISLLCNREFTATQYALFSALAAVGRTTVSASSGAWVDLLGWDIFFVGSAAMALPGILMVVWLSKSQNIDGRHGKRKA